MSEQHAGLSHEFIEQQHQRLMTLRNDLLGGERSTLAGERQFHQQHGDEAEEFEEEAQDMARMEVDQAVQEPHCACRTCTTEDRGWQLRPV